MLNFHLLFVLLFSLTGFSQNKLDIFFDFNKDVPNEASQIKVDQWVSANKTAEIIQVLGYCDSVDNSKYNKDLAMRRVNAMIKFFNNNNIKIADRVEVKAIGKDFKYSKNQSENRKVEVIYNLITANNTDEKNAQIIPDGPFRKRRIKEVTIQEIKEEDIVEVADMDLLVENERTTLVSKFYKARKGDLVRINNINFYFNSERVMEQSMPLLDELLDIMMNNPKLVLEIHGHICCNPNPNDTKLSYRRALVILKYLTKYGVEVKRLAFRGYGSNDPIYKLPEKNEKERAANRRVEILIVNK